jgi:hypothetical protein
MIVYVYSWRVMYQDGTIINELDGHEWSDVDIAKLKYVYIIDWLGTAVLSIAIVPEHPPEFFRRVVEGKHATCVGWPGAYVWFLDNGTMALTAIKDEVTE